MNLRTLESNTRMRFLLGNNPIGELVKLVSDQYKKIAKTKGYERKIRNKR